MFLLQENNFKAVLESIRDLMNEDTVMPDWLHDIFLGYGDPAQAKYTHMPADQLLQTIDFKVLPADLQAHTVAFALSCPDLWKSHFIGCNVV